MQILVENLTYTLVIHGSMCILLSKNLVFVWLKELHQVLKSTLEPRTASLRKILDNQTLNL